MEFFCLICLYGVLCGKFPSNKLLGIKMTLVAAWVKRLKRGEELYVASDSRLSGGRVWDIGNKILDLGRGDSVIAFAGETHDAYPLMLQLQLAVKMHHKTLSRANDLTDLKGHVLRIFNAMWADISDLPVGRTRPDPSDVRFILCGYSWKVSSFRIWTLYFHEPTGEFKFRQASKHREKGGGNKYFAFIGDDPGLAQQRVYDLLKSRGRIKSQGMKMEPLEILIEFIRDKDRRTIGGAPQVIKIYRHLNTMPLNVYWPNLSAGQISFMGRSLLPYERNEYMVLDPDTFEVSNPIWPDPYFHTTDA